MDGVTTNYTLDLAVGLTQVLADGTNTYLYGNGRISQSPIPDAQLPEYFLGDALGSVRQLADTTGAITLTQSYAPYGEVTQSVGTSQTSYAFTGENLDANGLTFLRARYLDSSAGRFTQRDPSGLEANLYLYAQANPVNRIDPSGLFSDQQIAESFGYPNIETLLHIFYNVDQRFNSNPIMPHQSRWGFFSALLDAEDGDLIQSGNLTLSTLYPHVKYKKPELIWSLDGCGGNIMIGNRSLDNYFRHVLSMPNWRELFVFWRNTSPRYYILSSTNQTKGYYVDGTGYMDGKGTNDLPDFHSVDIGFGESGRNLSGLVDRFGNIYVMFGASKGKGAGVFYSEGYVCAHAICPSRDLQSFPMIQDEAMLINSIKGEAGGVSLMADWGISYSTGGSSSVLMYSFGYGYSLSASNVGETIFTNIKNGRLGWNSYIDEQRNGVSYVDLLTKVKVNRLNQ